MLLVGWGVGAAGGGEGWGCVSCWCCCSCSCWVLGIKPVETMSGSSISDTKGFELLPRCGLVSKLMIPDKGSLCSFLDDNKGL